ncbi:MAG: orotate phosphoribosyltransferase [bacterium]
MFRRLEAIREGHFLLASGLHSPLYFDKMKVLAEPEAASFLCQRLAEKLKGKEAQIVVGPSLGGVIIAFEVAKYLGLKCAFADRVENKRVIRPKDILKEGMRIALVDDILTTGKSVKETLSALHEYESEVVAVAVILDRSGGEVNLGIPLISLASMKVEAYKPEECPLCKRGIPLEVFGSATRKG